MFTKLLGVVDGMKAMCNGEDVQYRQHIGGGHYVSVTSGFKCVDFRKFYMPYNQSDIRPTKSGITLRLDEWADMRSTIQAVVDMVVDQRKNQIKIIVLFQF